MPEGSGYRYRLGLPAWAFPGWKDRFWGARPTPLASYSSVFDAVEGNTTFYRIPEPSTVRGWLETVAERDFEFAFKLPRTVTHERRADFDDLHRFLRAIEPLGAHRGPLLVQFPARVGPRDVEAIDALLARLPDGTPHVLEVRHPRFFEEPRMLEPLLDRHGSGLVTLDTRALYGGDLTHPDVVGALHEKPDLPVLGREANGLLFLRLVLHPQAIYNGATLDDWATRVAGLLDSDVTVYAMIHCPNNLYCPGFAREFHDRLRARAPENTLAPLPPWPAPQQAGLF